MSGDILGGMRGVSSWSRGVCCSDTSYFFPMTSRPATTLENFGREEGFCRQHMPMILASSFVHW